MHSCRAVCLGLALTAAVVGDLPAQPAATAPWAEVGRRLQTTETPSPGYHRYNLPRRDITLMLGDVKVAAALALGSWAGFAGDAAKAMAMGDLVLLPSELQPVLAELARQRIGVSAIHNHLVGEQPHLVYVHFEAMGDAIDVATRLGKAIALTATPLPVTNPPPSAPTIDSALVFRALGLGGRANGAIAQVTAVLVATRVTLRGHSLPPMLAVASPINIQEIAVGRAVATGDFAVLERRVAPLLDALASNGITATAVHTHMIGETPRVYFIHFWADGPLTAVCAGLRAALDAAR